MYGIKKQNKLSFIVEIRELYYSLIDANINLSRDHDTLLCNIQETGFIQDALPLSYIINIMNPFALPAPARKFNRSDYGIQQQLLQLLYRLNDKKSSQIFRQPVSTKDAPDYFLKIKQPMDLSTIENKLKQGQYYYADEVLRDLHLIIGNCLQYNQLVEGIRKTAEKFNECISTEWTNFVDAIVRKGIDINSQLEISDDMLERLLGMDERRKKRKTATTMSLLPSGRGYGENQYEFYASLSSVALKSVPEESKNESQFQGFEVKVDDFATMTEEQRKTRLLIVLNEEQISQEFKELSKAKLEKYRGILTKKINWFRDKILKKTMQSKKFANLLVPAHLQKNIQNDDFAKSLNIRKLQLFVKQIAYFIQAFQHILSDRMKQKFLTNCRAIRSCMAQIIKYKRIAPKSTKIKIENPFIQIKPQPANQPINIPEPENPMNDKDQVRSNLSEETKGYEQKMKEFRRLLDKDKKDHTRKDTKVRLNREESGIITSSIVYEDSDKKKAFSKKFSKDTHKIDLPKEDEEKRREEEQNEEKAKDNVFLGEYNKRSNVGIIREYGGKAWINWERGVEAKLGVRPKIQFYLEKY